jgi:Lrp/AsnC family transcriptional regulator for asnA, asnC and gidA
MDELDRCILRALQEDGRLPFTHIARQTGVSETTVRTRYQKLVQQGIVRTVALIEPRAVDYEAAAIVAVSVEPGMANRIAQAMARVPEVSHLVRTLGTYDLILEIYCQDLNHLSDVITGQIHRVAGVRATETFMIAERYKQPFEWSPYLEGKTDDGAT